MHEIYFRTNVYKSNNNQYKIANKISSIHFYFTMHNFSVEIMEAFWEVKIEDHILHVKALQQ